VFLMPLKYPVLDCLSRRTESWLLSLLALRVAFVYPLGRVVIWGVHQGLDLEEGRDHGVEALIMAVRTVGAEEN